VLAVTKLDKEARNWLEREVDSVISDTYSFEAMAKDILSRQGIEPNLETILSFLTGTLTGMVSAHYVAKYKRMPNDAEFLELYSLLKRRAFEMRMAFMNTRVEE